MSRKANMNIEKLQFIRLLTTAKIRKYPKIVETPQKGKWYRVELPGCICGNGMPYYCSLKIGAEHKLIILFCGGGVSWNSYTAARSITTQSVGQQAFYFDRVEPLSMGASMGLGSCTQDNLFQNWSVLFINYGSGDFHVGQKDYHYTALNGKKAVLHHHGYRNFQASLRAARQYISDPEQLLIAGASAGGFGAAALANHILQEFPDCHNAVCCVDGALLLNDWQSAVADVWHAPESICRPVQSSNIVLDWLKRIYQVQQDRIRYLFISSIRDNALVKFQSYMDHGTMIPREEAAITFENNLKDMCTELQEEIPRIGLYLFDTPGRDQQLRLTQHTILMSNNITQRNSSNISVQDWLWHAANGHVYQIGLDLLQK